MRIKPLITVAMALALALPALASSAEDDDAERENLARISHEIEQIQVMVKAASSTAPSAQRVKFRYDWLLRDLQMMRDGIDQHTDAPRQPRPAPPLRGEYRQ